MKSPLIEGIRHEIRQLLDQEPFTAGTANRIAKIAKRANGLLVAIDPTQKDAARDHLSNTINDANFYCTDDDVNPPNLISGPVANANPSLAPFSGPETFGANALRELVPILSRILAKPKSTTVEVPKQEPDDWESTGSLVLAYKQAQDAGLHDVAAQILARIEARTHPDVKAAVEEIKRSKALVKTEDENERRALIDDLLAQHLGAPDISFSDLADPGPPDISFSEDVEDPTESPTPTPNQRDRFRPPARKLDPEGPPKYGVRTPPNEHFDHGPFDTIEEARQHASDNCEIVELPSNRVVQINVETP